MEKQQCQFQMFVCVSTIAGEKLNVFQFCRNKNKNQPSMIHNLSNQQHIFCNIFQLIISFHIRPRCFFFFGIFLSYFVHFCLFSWLLCFFLFILKIISLIYVHFSVCFKYFWFVFGLFWLFLQFIFIFFVFVLLIFLIFFL